MVCNSVGFIQFRILKKCFQHLSKTNVCYTQNSQIQKPPSKDELAQVLKVRVFLEMDTAYGMPLKRLL